MNKAQSPKVKEAKVEKKSVKRDPAASKKARDNSGSSSSSTSLALADRHYEEIILADIGPNPLNPRKNFSGPKFEEMMASIKKVGVIEPILIRPVKGKIPYEIIAGERRWRASCEIAGGNGGLKTNTIPAIVRDINDDEAFDLMTIENLQREDLTELEEAQSFKLYLDKHGKESVSQLSERTGIKPSYINRRVAVLGLPAEVLTLWEKGKIKYGHCEQLIRLPDKKEIIEFTKNIIDSERWNPVTIKDLKSRIDNHAVILSKALFDTKKSGCETCSSNSKVQCDMFAEETGKILCLNVKCFKQNQNNWLMANWKTEFKKKTGTNGFRFCDDIHPNKHHDFDSWVGKPGVKCKDCSSFVSLIQLDAQIRDKQSCVGDESCFKSQIASGKKEEKKKADAKKSGAPDGQEVEIPRVAWHGKFFVEEYYKEVIPRSVQTLSYADAEHTDKILRMSLISLLIANTELKKRFALRWMQDTYRYDEEQDCFYEENNQLWGGVDEDKIFYRLLKMTYFELLEAHKEAASQTIMRHNAARPTIRHAVALHMGIKAAEEWRMTKDYLDKKTTKEILELIDKLGIAADEKALAFLHENLNKKRGKFNTCKKTELISLIMDSGIDLAGRIPKEILNAIMSLESAEDADADS